jgi:HK97 family phage major capsid protein
MLKQLKIQKSLELKRSKLQEIEKKYENILKRSEDAKKALEEADNDEDLKVVEAEITEIEKEEETVNNEKKNVETEIEQLELELEEVEERSKQDNKQQKRNNVGVEKGMNKLQVRELLKTGEYYNRSDVKEFYDKFKNLRQVGGSELVIPEVIVNRIMDLLGDYSTLYPLVDKIRISGTARVLIDTDTTPAEWLEMGAALPVEDVGTIVSIDLDGFKTGKICYIDNYLLQDSYINLDEYVSKKIARSIGLALDVAMLTGDPAGRQPTGIIPSLPGENIVDVGTDATIGELVAPIANIDTGLDNVGEISAVMRRSTYYSTFLPFSINVNSEGNVVGKLPNLTRPDILGLPVIFNNAMSPGEVLYGDFGKYTLVERESITIDSSDQVRFVEDQTAFRGKGRFDGKPTKTDAFCLVRIGTPTV